MGNGNIFLPQNTHSIPRSNILLGFITGYADFVDAVSRRIDPTNYAPMEKMVKTFMLLRHLEDYPRMRKAEVEYYQKHAPHLVEYPPVSTFMQLSSLSHPEALFEIDVFSPEEKELTIKKHTPPKPLYLEDTF
jgi:hypothetical protein